MQSIERAESAHDLTGRRIFILNVQTRSGSIWSRPEPLPFAELETLKRHVCDLIAHNLKHVDDRRRRQMITYLEAKHYSKVIQLFRSAQMDNKSAIPLDFFWQEGATVIM